MQTMNAAHAGRTGDRRSYAQASASRDARTPAAPHPIGRLLGVPDAGDLAVADAVAAARAREQAARDKLARERAEKAAMLERSPTPAGARKPAARPRTVVNVNGLDLPWSWKLSKVEGQLFVLMATRSWDSLADLTAALYGGSGNLKSDRACCSATIGALRRKLAPFHIDIPSSGRGVRGTHPRLELSPALRRAIGLAP